MTARTITSRLICIALIFSLVGCGWKVTPPNFEQKALDPSPLAEAAVLTVNDVGIIWGNGELGEIVRKTLMERRTFKEVYYPVEPRNPPDYRILVTANGSIEEEVGFGIVKSIFIGMLFFIPVGIIRFNKDFLLDADVTVIKQNQELLHFTIKTETEVSHTMFSHANQYEPVARQKAFEDLALRVISKLKSI
mgnify:CR=1 FL=1